MHRRINRPVAVAFEHVPHTARFHHQADALPAAVVRMVGEVVFHVVQRRGGVEVGGGEQIPDGLRGHLAAVGVGVGLHLAGELNLQAARHDHAEFSFHQIRHAAFARLAVDADDGVVGAAHVGRVDGQVGHIPQAFFVQRREAFFDCVLVRAAEGGEHQIAHVGVARVDGQLVAMLHRAGHGVDV